MPRGHYEGRSDTFPGKSAQPYASLKCLDTNACSTLCVVAAISLMLQSHSGIANVGGVLPWRDPGVLQGEGGEGIVLHMRAAGMYGAVPRDG